MCKIINDLKYFPRVYLFIDDGFNDYFKQESNINFLAVN